MDETDAYTPPGAPLPSVAQVRALGVRSVRVFCAADLVCAHSRQMTFGELRLTDDDVIVRAARQRRFVCTCCGSRKVQVRPEWPAHKATGPFYSPAMDGS
ncbi:MAG: hypothetical protein QOC72_2009 [Methylobacteriaceae bacterium]|jgi:hypothetical protein|nr:hypothetical protein [Methylobacteriaceae bacterium]